MKETANFEVRGMHCASCAARIEKVVSKMDGVSEVKVNLTTEKGRVTFHNNQTSVTEIINRINQIGFAAKQIGHSRTWSDTSWKKEIQILQRKLFLSAILTFPLAWAMLDHFSWASFIYVPDLFTHPFFQMAVILPIQFIIGQQFYDSAWKAVKNGSANMDVLVVLSTSAAFFYSHYLTFTSQHTDSTGLFYETSAFIITFILLGKLLEAKTKLKTTEAIKELYQLQTKAAMLISDGRERECPVDQLSPGDLIIVRPGEKVPIDGEIVDGGSMIDESLLTGESNPVEKQIGDPVFAGTINQNGVLYVRVTKKDSETALSQIIRIVEEAQASSPPIQRIADDIVAIFVPIVLSIALVTFAAWYFVLQPGDVNGALVKTIAVLIIACPCALGLATPTSVLVGSGQAARSGILFKEGKYLELLGKNNMVVFDKTGTITKGQPQVTDIYTERLSENLFLEMIAAVESTLQHPVAKAIVTEAKKRLRHLPRATQVLSMPGYGVSALVNGKKIVIASSKYYDKSKRHLPRQALKRIRKLEAEGKTVMIAMIDNRFAGIIAIADEIKPSSLAAVSRLKKMGMDVVMLTGDNRSIATTVATRLGIKKLYAEVTPGDKAAIIHSLQQKGNRVVMVGDGINDAPSLAVADVGIAMGTGSDIAIESGDVTILKGDLHRVVDAFIISRKTMNNIKQNLLWAFLYNIIMIPVAMLGFLSPWLAGAAMAFSSVSVVLNALRLNLNLNQGRFSNDQRIIRSPSARKQFRGSDRVLSKA